MIGELACGLTDPANEVDLAKLLQDMIFGTSLLPFFQGNQQWNFNTAWSCFKERINGIIGRYHRTRAMWTSTSPRIMTDSWTASKNSLARRADCRLEWIILPWRERIQQQYFYSLLVQAPSRLSGSLLLRMVVSSKTSFLDYQPLSKSQSYLTLLSLLGLSSTALYQSQVSSMLLYRRKFWNDSQ